MIVDAVEEVGRSIDRQRLDTDIGADRVARRLERVDRGIEVTLPLGASEN